MRNIFITFFFLLASCVIKAQAYIPLPLDSSYWRVNYGATQPNCSCSVFYLYKTDGDTIINSTTYKKIIRAGAQGCAWCGPYSGAILGSLRQDSLTRKVYIVQNNSTTEKILYDFTQQVGDTVKSALIVLGCTFIVSSVDSIQINSVYHRRINIQTNGCLVTPQAFIEGIGSTQGLLEPLIGFEFGGTLECAAHKNQVIYPSNTSTCSTIVTGLSEINNSEARIDVFPNPASNKLTVSANLNSLYTIEIERMDGVIVYSKEETQPATSGLEINTTCFPAGIYFLKFSNEN
ncbi:MAG: T9SS type A sorting domain-containing protein, partial [Bacteroidia bacterium]